MGPCPWAQPKAQRESDQPKASSGLQVSILKHCFYRGKTLGFCIIGVLRPKVGLPKHGFYNGRMVFSCRGFLASFNKVLSPVLQPTDHFFFVFEHVHGIKATETLGRHSFFDLLSNKKLISQRCSCSQALLRI